MATQAAMRLRVRDYLYSHVMVEHEFVHQINGAILAAATSVVVDNGVNFDIGDIIEFANGDQRYVVSVSTHTLTVIPDWAGSTSTDQVDNAWIRKNPRFNFVQVDNAIAGVIAELEREGVYAYGTGDVTLVTGQYWYDLTETDIVDALGVLSAYYPHATLGDPVPLPFHNRMQLNTTASATGHGIRLWEWGAQGNGDKVYFTYAKRIDATTDLMTRQEELVVKGAVAKLMLMSITPFGQDPGQRTDRTQQSGVRSRDARSLQGEYFLAVKGEAANLKAEVKRLPGSVKINRGRGWSA